MKITLETTPPVDIELHDEISMESLISTLAAHPAIQEIAKDVGSGSYFERFEPYNGVYDRSQLVPIVDAYLRGGIEAAEEYVETEDGWANSPETAFAHSVKSELESEMRTVADLVTAHERFEDAENEITDGLTEALEELCIEAMADADKSKITSLFGSHDKFEMSFGIDLDKLGVEDLHMYYSRKNWFSVETLDPDAKFMRMFKLMNISPSAFIEYIIEAHGYDPRNTEMPEGVTADSWTGRAILEQANRWQAFSDVAYDGIVSRETRSKFEDGFDRYCDALEVEGRTVCDLDRPAAMSMEELCVLIDNAGGGGVPVYTGRYQMKDILSGKLDKPFIAKKGLIGIHDFVNGSGHMVDNDIEVLINPTVGGFRTKSINGPYDFNGSAFDNEITPVDGVDWVHFVADCWRAEPGLDGAYAELWAEETANGVTYWLSTYDKNRDAAGLYAESEAFDSLEEAKKVGLSVTRKSAAELEAEADAEFSGPAI
jgi:hypothetical protein